MCEIALGLVSFLNLFEWNLKREGFVKVGIEGVLLDSCLFLLQPLLIQHDSYLDVRIGQSAYVHLFQILSEGVFLIASGLSST